MLTSSASQYLHPDYLNPLPTTLDAKKSPLALLAQTCSSIGKDTTPSKPIIPPIEKSKESQTNSNSNNAGRKSESPTSKTSRSSAEERKSQPSHNHSGEKRDDRGLSRSSPSRDDDSKASFRAPVPKEIPPLVPISTVGEKSRPSSSSPVNSKCGSDRDRDSRTPVSSSGPSAGLQSNSRISLSCGNMLLEVNHQEAATAAAAGLPKSSLAPSHPTLGSTLPAYPGFSHSLGGYAGCLPMLGHPIAMDAATASAMHHSGLSAHSGLGLASAAAKAGLAGSGISPYSYARVKSTSGATTLVPICRDPYCTNCQITMQNAQLSSGCAAGCTQCSHEKALTTPTSLAQTSLGTVPVLPLGSALSASHHGSSIPLSSSLYHHAFSILPGHHTLPYVCNWMAGSEYCGKRFTTSEELLQHLRTHTSGNPGDSLAGLSAAYAGLGGLPAPAHLGAACHSHYPGSLSPNSLRQAYSRSLSPNTLLAASRYHPYKSPLSSLPVAPSPALPGGLPSSLGAYYSPYALYGQRIGAAVAP